MGALLSRSHTSTPAASLVGTLVGIAALCLYFGAGLLVAEWSFSAFLTRISVDTVGYLFAMNALTVAFVGFPIFLFLRFELRTPLGVLVAVIFGWLILGVVQGILSLQTIFGLALYAVYLSPIALILYAVFGGSEYLFRAKMSSR